MICAHQIACEQQGSQACARCTGYVQGSQACANCRPAGCRANFRALTLIVSISGLAAFNALYVPLKLEQAVHRHPRSTALLAAAQAPDWPSSLNSTSAGTQPKA